MMELTDSGIQLSESATTTTQTETRSPLGIDLNEIPSCPPCETLFPELDALTVVRSYHDNLTPADGAPVEIPGEEGGEKGCVACRLPEVRGFMVVCDGCERGFHLSCTGTGRQPETTDEWVCGECVCVGVKSKRWPLGFSSNSSGSSGPKRGSGGVRLLDINALPPSDGECEGSEELQDLRKHIAGDNSFGGNPFGDPVTYSNNLYAGGFAFQRASGIMTHGVKLGFEDTLHHTQAMVRSCEEIKFGFPIGMSRCGNDTAIRVQSRNPSEMFLQSLREFISERHGMLGEGWSVEVRQSMGSSELHAVYCAPDGKIFGSKSEVAYYLGLISNGNSFDEVRRERSASLQKRSHLNKRRKSTRVPVANGFIENKETFMSGIHKELSSDRQSMEICASEFGNNKKFTDSEPEVNGGTGCQQLDDALPLQYEDFFILSLGKIDLRPSYHDISNIWPIGYRSCFHDRITGSFFICNVLDGGECGPIFRVKRCSCSTLPIPIGSTILFRPNLGRIDGQIGESDGITSFPMDSEEDGSIQMILAESCPPMGNVIMSCLGCSYNEACDVQTTNRLQVEANPLHEESRNILYGNSGLGDEIGDFSEEGRLSSSVWKMVCQKIIETCREIYRRTGTLNFFCKHFENTISSSCRGMKDEKIKAAASSLAKFSSYSGYVDIMSTIPVDFEFETLSNVLSQWLDQDRFGLDVEFVQEIIEQLPGVHTCSQYEFLNKRSYYSALQTIGNGSLLVKTESGVQDKEEALNGLFKGCKRARTQLVEDSLMDDNCPPVGKPLGTRLPSELVGDVLQVWEFFWRFCEILGLTEPLSLEELEEELISPWCDGLDKFGGEESHDKISHRTGVIDGANGHILSSSSESGPALSCENLHAFIQMETGAMKEAAQARVASLTYGRCTGVALTKAHNSLLKALVTELQSKVAGLVDPSFDAGEFKPRRGKRKDFDNSTISKKIKLNMLPINELTWPEIARRYALAFLTMDGNLDSPESTTRESGKVFRCLQGDGGVLCGSLTGVAGMKADALLLAEATKQIFGSLNRNTGVFTIEDEEPDAPKAGELIVENKGYIPEWAQVLEPVRKLPTNVGTRIRKCVYDALEKGPPEWAREILKHSISKGVYKGNASGPTKKAVLSVLGNVSAEGLQRQPERERKRKSVVSISDIIMKKCRIVLRRAASEDDAKFFCNLLGQNLMNSSDNDDEGLLGSPAMVSRPLDFRTIDLRLTVGVYDGSHEAFLEDVRELWNNVRIAFVDQPDLVELAETLAQKFESLYENEVVVLVQKLMEYAKLESLSTETKKEIDDIVVSTADIPKAPWDEGVCKVCGIDKNDDSVLLCDTCDAEYHTYCLNPPLARIPEGNWYCPSCVLGKSQVQQASGRTRVIGQHRRKKYGGEYTRHYLETLTNLVAVMGEKEYWEVNIDERTFLLKFLCDELLNSALVHQHLEQCAETSAELQQKLRSISAEWKNLKFREEILVSRAARLDKGLVDAVGESGKVDKLTTALPNLGKCMEQLCSDRPNYADTSSDDLPRIEAGQEGTGHYDFDKQLSVNSSRRNLTSNNQVLKLVDSNDVHAIGDGNLVDSISFSNMASRRNEKFFGPNDSPLQSPLQHEICGGISSQCNIQECSGRDTSILSSSDSQGMCFSSEKKNTHVSECAPPIIVNESQAYDIELNSVKGDILLLQDSITSLESQLLKQTIRREFLGSDAAGRLYWVTAKPGQHPWVIVDGSLALHQERKMADNQNLRENNEALNPPSIGKDTVSTLLGSKCSSPFAYGQRGSLQICSSWVAYQSDADIEELIGWLNENDPKERELKESILQVRKPRYQDYQQTRNLDQEEPQKTSSMLENSHRTPYFDSLVTKAATLLEKNYGPCLDMENAENVRKRGKKAKLISEGKMYRCECLEPIWPSRHHCLSCHQTFPTEVELEGHNDGRCSVGPSASEKGKENSECSKGKGIMKLKTTIEDCIGDMDKGEASKNGCLEFTSRLIKFQNEGLVCPYDFEEISSKFVTKDSNKDLVQEIGLIGSNGVPSFVPSVSPYLSESTLMLVSQREIGAPGKEPKPVEKSMFSHIGHDVAYNSPSGCAENKISQLLETDGMTVGCLEPKDRKRSLNSCVPERDIGHYCVVSESSLRPLVGKISQILRRLKISLLDMDAALPEEALRVSKAHLEKRWAWRAFVKSAQNIFEMVQATIILEDMIKTEYLRNGWWYWSSLSAAAKISTVSSLALRIYTLDTAIIYEKNSFDFDSTDNFMPNSKLEQNPSEKSKVCRKASKRRKESED